MFRLSLPAPCFQQTMFLLQEGTLSGTPGSEPMKELKLFAYQKHTQAWVFQAIVGASGLNFAFTTWPPQKSVFSRKQPFPGY